MDSKRRKMDLDISIETDDVLNVEENYYQEGFMEGQLHSTRQQMKEGKEYGYQTGFQRFLIIGYIEGLLEYWRPRINDYVDGLNTSLSNHMTLLSKILSQISTKNGDEDVEIYEKLLQKARNKLRIIGVLTKESRKIDHVDTLVKEVGGTMLVSENVDDMW